MATDPRVPFNSVTECPKCGSEDILRTYEKNAHDYNCPASRTINCCSFEHHCRRCRGCGYKFVEAVKEPRHD